VVLLPQAGNRDAVFRLELVIVRGGAWHLRTLQVGRCCTSLLNPPCHIARQSIRTYFAPLVWVWNANFRSRNKSCRFK
jgi:hypothetical protein